MTCASLKQAMRTLWQEWRELIWSSRYDPVASHQHRIAVLEVFLGVVIAVAAGPEVFAAMEMTALMELLGGLLFLTAMAAGARLLVADIWNAFCKLLLPVPLAALVRPDASVPRKALASIYVVAIALWSLVMALDGRYIGSLNCAGYRT